MSRKQVVLVFAFIAAVYISIVLLGRCSSDPRPLTTNRSSTVAYSSSDLFARRVDSLKRRHQQYVKHANEALTASLGCGGKSLGARLVLRIIDGDTYEIQGLGRVRIIGVDTDEAGTPAGDATTILVRDFLLSGLGSVRVSTEKGERDRYGRLLAHVYSVDRQEDLALWLLRKKLARPMFFAPNTCRQKAYEDLYRTIHGTEKE